VSPNELIDRFGDDAVRLYILFYGPADQDINWSPDGIAPMARFVKRLWREVPRSGDSSPESPAGVDTPLARKAHEAIARVTDDIDRRFQFQHPDRRDHGARQRAVEGTRRPRCAVCRRTRSCRSCSRGPRTSPKELWQGALGPRLEPVGVAVARLRRGDAPAPDD